MELSGEERVMARAPSHLAVSRLSHRAVAHFFAQKNKIKGFPSPPLHFNPLGKISLSNGSGLLQKLLFSDSIFNSKNSQ